MRQKRPYLTVYEYGGGGVWMLIDARSGQEIETKWPKLKAFEDRPDWIMEEVYQEYLTDIEEEGFRWDIDEESTGWLAKVAD